MVHFLGRGSIAHTRPPLLAQAGAIQGRMIKIKITSAYFFNNPDTYPDGINLDTATSEDLRGGNDGGVRLVPIVPRGEREDKRAVRLALAGVRYFRRDLDQEIYG